MLLFIFITMTATSIILTSLSWMISVSIMIPPSVEETNNSSLSLPSASSSSDGDEETNVSFYAINSTVEYLKIYPEGAVWNAELIQRVATLTVIMVATLIGNTIVVLALSRSRYRKRFSRVNIFILNLAIGDLAVCCITMTSELLFEVFGEWVLGAIACKVIVYGQIVTLASTTFILTTMSYDRYQAICRPLRSTGGVKQAKRMIAASWVLAFVFAIPQLFIFVQVQEGVTETGRPRYECLSRGYQAWWQRKLYFTWLTTYILIIPACCISYCYINVLRTVWAAGKENKSNSAFRLRRSFNAASTIPRAKMKTLKLTICIIASFIICWTPYFIVHNIRIYSNYSIQVHKTIVIGAETIALLQSALNPIFYGYFNVRVRKGFIEIVYKKKDPRGCMESCNGRIIESGDTSYSSTMIQQADVRDRSATTQLEIEMLDCCGNLGSTTTAVMRLRRSPHSMKRRGHYQTARL